MLYSKYISIICWTTVPFLLRKRQNVLVKGSFHPLKIANLLIETTAEGRKPSVRMISRTSSPLKQKIRTVGSCPPGDPSVFTFSDLCRFDACLVEHYWAVSLMFSFSGALLNRFPTQRVLPESDFCCEFATFEFQKMSVFG